MTTRYEDVPGVRFTHLKELAKSGLHYQHALKNERELTVSLKQGIALHCLVLTPDLAQDSLAVYEGARRGKAWEGFEAQNRHRLILTDSEFEPVEGMAKAICLNREAARLLETHGLRREEMFQRQGRKCRVDAIDDYGTSIIDLKSCADASPAGFERAIQKYLYHAQAAYYMRITGATEWRWLVVEKSTPHVVQVYRASEELLKRGSEIVDELELKLKTYTETGNWFGYADHELEATLPAWMQTENIDDAGLDWGNE